MRRMQGWVVVLGLLGVFAPGCTEGTSGGVLPDGSFFDLDGSTLTDGAVSPGDAGARVDGGPPGACDVETCGDGLDGDCDGRVDEQCPCLPGETQSCFRGPSSARGVGACANGSQACTDGFEFSTWGECAGDVLPTTEVCDAAGVDEDCDGAVNEGCACDPSAPPSACGSDVGACAAGTQACVDGRLEACEGAIGPSAEACNGLDDDCDGATDEGVTRACGTDVGECSVGVEVCVGGAFQACTGSGPAAAEDCNGLDDDCDGATDEGLVRACGSSTGACRPGMQACAAGAWGACGGETLPGVEACNALDDDCDGATDESLVRACGSSTGACRPGTEVCAAGAYGACTGGVGPGVEVCEGRLDENCNGTVDEGCGCTTGATRACGTDVGACVAGSQACDATGNWAACAGSIGPVVETCNRLDDDCDGMTDEAGVCPTSPPVAMCPAAITANVLATISLSGSGSDPDGGTVTYQWTIATRPTGSTATPATPTRASTTQFLDASGAYVARLCVTDDEMQTTCCETPITSRAPGALVVQMNWSTPGGDVDLHVLDTARVADDGWFTTDDCYWANPAPDWGALGAVGNPTLDRDDRDGYGPENVTIANTPVPGRYSIGVHSFCSTSAGGAGPTVGTVRVYCDGALIATYPDVRLERTDDWRTVAVVDYPTCVGMSVNRLTNGSSILPAAFTAARHCELSCVTDADCPRSERCAAVAGGGRPRYACVLAR